MVAACMLAGTTPVLTGCIDNDEPAGIEQLRVAKSELIKAKVALVEAEKGKMEAEKLKIEMEAEIARAKAAILDAYAEKQAALAQAAKDSAEYIAQIYDLKIQEEQARVNKSIAEYKQKEAEAEAKYQEALKDIELAKLTLSAEQWTNLAHYTDAVDDAKAELDRYQSYYERHLEAYNNALSTYMSGEGAAIKYQYSLEKAVREDSAAVVAAQEAVEVAEETLAKPIEATAWEEEMNELQAQLDEIAKQEADLQVVKAKFQAAHQEEFAAMQDSLTKAVEEYGATVKYEDENGNIVEEVASTTATGLKLSEYKYDAEGVLGGEQATHINFTTVEVDYNYQAYADGLEAIAEGTATQEDLAMSGIAPFVQLQFIDHQIKGVKLFALNDNEKEWAQHDIAVLNQKLKEAQEEYEAAYTEWNTVKNAYNHVSTVTNPTQLPVGAALNEKITAYNTAATANKAAIDAMDAAEKTFIEALKKADENATAVTDYANIHTVLEAEVTTQTTNVVNAKTVYDSAVTALEALQNDPNATNQQIQDAQKAVDDALKAMEDANTLLAAAQNNLKAIEDANTAYTAAVEVVNGDGTEQNKGTAKLAAEAYTAVADAYVAYVNYIMQLEIFDWTVDYLGTLAQIINTQTPDANGNLNVTTIDAAKALEVSQDRMYNVLATLSAEVWGDDWVRIDDNVRILPATKEDVDANIKELYAQKNAGEELPDYLVQFYYDGRGQNYGLFGETLDLTADLARATSFLNGGDKEIDRIVTEMEAVKAEMQKEIDANTKLVTDLVNGFLTARTAYNQAYQTEVGEELAAINAEKLQLQPVINALKGAIDGYLMANKGQYATPAQNLTEFKLRLEAVLADAQETLLEEEANLKASRADLANYLAGYNDRDKAMKTAEDNLARAQEKRDAAKEVYDAAVAELQAILDALSAE